MTTLQDVITFIQSASYEDKKAIVNELAELGMDYHCANCEGKTDDCDCDLNAIGKEANKELLMNLVHRGNVFGIDDMIEHMNYEGREYGAVLKIEKTA